MSNSENQEKAAKLILSLIQRLSLDLLQDAIVFGSAAIALNGVDLGRQIDDLDVFVSDHSYNRMKANPLCHEIEKKSGVYSLQVNGIIDAEILMTFPGVIHAEVTKRARTHPNSYGVLVASMDDLCTWKRAQGRKKDLQDLSRMGC